MPSTLHRLHRHRQVASVVDLEAARVCLRGDQATRARTLLVRCATQRADEEIIRYLGVDADSSLEELQRALGISLSLSPVVPLLQHGLRGRKRTVVAWIVQPRSGII